ncbi:MAG: nuclear transport factor 2 family protein [Owenweeksia sp.]
MPNTKEEFLRKFNQAFLEPDIPLILDCVTDDVHWEMVGDQTFIGKEKIREFFHRMDNSSKLVSIEIENIITHGKNASVNGTMKMNNQGKEESYGFCDVYKFSGFKNPRISKLTSFVVSLKD